VHARVLDWTSVSTGVQQLLMLIDEGYTPPSERTRAFRLARMTIEPEGSNAGTLLIAAFDEDDRPFEYAVFVRGNHIETDGY